MTSFYKGYIEGYYGKLFSFAERKSLLKDLKAIGGNTYVYAPKEDPFHRRFWRKAYPKPWQREFKDFITVSKKHGIDVIPGMAPGLSYDYTSAKDYKILLKKLLGFVELGCTSLALLMDDISPDLPKPSEGKFASLGEAHALLVQSLQADLQKTLPSLKLWFCPTVYTDQFAKMPLKQCPYLLDLAKGLPKNIPLFWTGPRIISEKLRPEDLSVVTSMFPGQIVLWDNLYANDYCPSKLFVGPYCHRPASLTKSVKGILLNPTGLPETDRFLLQLMHGFSQGKKAEIVWEKVAKKFEVPTVFKDIMIFFDTPFFIPKASDFTPKKLEIYKKALFHLLWEWKSPLQREWYAFLYGLDHDLSLHWKGKARRDMVWIRKKYAPALAYLFGAYGKKRNI